MSSSCLGTFTEHSIEGGMDAAKANLPLIAKSLQEISNNMARANVLKALEMLHNVDAIPEATYVYDLKDLLKSYNFDLYEGYEGGEKNEDQN